MTGRHGPLTSLRVKRLRKPGRYGDGNALFLNVAPGGTKSWILLYKHHGKRHAVGLGSLNLYSLKEARERAAEARKQIWRDIKEGREPQRKRGQGGAVTFGKVADELFERERGGWRNEKHIWQWRQTLEVHCKRLRDKPVASIGTQDVLAVIKPMWLAMPTTAMRTRTRIEKVLDYARAHGHRDPDTENPARWRGHLSELLPKRKVVREHHPAMALADVPGFMGRLRKISSVDARALEFLILTAARSGEVTGAVWPEIDLEAKVWTIPKGRMKSGREHQVPLSAPALAVLKEMAKLRASDFVFPGYRDGRPLTDNTLRDLAREVGTPDLTVHGFRSTFRDWCGDHTAYPREVAEAALAHAISQNQTEAAYRRGTAFEQRRALMADWAAYCEPRTGDTVIAMRRRKGA
jgi:integrase